MIDTDEGTYIEDQDIYLELTQEQFQLLWDAYPNPVRTRLRIGPKQNDLYCAMVTIDRIVVE